MKKTVLSLNVQHDYITLRTPNGNFTSSYSGAKASGRLAANAAAFKALDQFVMEKGKAITYGEAMKLLLDETTLASLWPDWNKEYTLDFGVGDTVTVPVSPKMGQGKVLEIGKKQVALVDFGPKGRTRIDGVLLKKVI